MNFKNSLQQSLQRSLQRRLSTRLTRLLTWLPWLLSIGIVCITFFFAWQTEQTERARDELRFAHQADQTLQAIQKRIDTYINFLVATRAHLATLREINASTFYNYLSQLDVEDTFPGFQAVGFAERIPPEKRQAISTRLEREGNPHFAIFPSPTNKESYVATYVFPVNEVNARAIGYDMSSEPVRWTAMERARSSESPISSGKVQLVQDVGPDKQAGFLIFLPTFIATSTDQRDSMTFEGFVYSAFRCDDLLRRISGDLEDPLVDFAVYDGDKTYPETELHNSARFNPSVYVGYTPKFSESRTIQIAGRPWTIIFTSRPRFETLTGRFPSRWVLILGSGLSLVFLLTGWMSARSHRRVLRQREWLRVTLASIGDAVIATDATSRILFLNSTAERLTGWSQQESMGRPLSQVLTVIDDRSGAIVEDIAGQALSKGDAIAFTDNISVKRRYGDLVPVEDTASPIKDASGRINGAIIVLHDISSRKRQERLDIASTQVVKILAYARSLDEVAEELIREIGKGLQCDHGALWIFDDAKNNLRCRANIGMSHEDYEVAREISKSCHPSWMILSHESPSTSPYGKLSHAGYSTVIGFPILLHGQPRGSMIIVSKNEIPSDSDTIAWLSSLALQLGQLVERKQEETRRQAIIEGAFDSIISFNTHGRILEMNEAAEHMFRGSRDELRRIPIFQLIESPDLITLLHTDQSHAATLNRVLKTTARTRKNEAFPIELTITEASIDGSQLFTAFIRNVLEQPREASDFGIHIEVLHNMSEGVCLTDERGTIIFTNPGEERMLNYERGELIGKNIALLFAEPTEVLPALVRNPSGHHVEGRYSGELHARRKGGEIITTYTQISGITFSGRRYLVCVQDDITDTKRWQSALIESEYRFRRMADCLPVLIWMTDSTKNPNFFNRSWLNTTGLSIDEALLEGWYMRVHPDDRAAYSDSTEKSLHEEAPYQIEYRLQRHDGEYRWIWEHGIPVHDADHVFTAYIGSGIDITDRKEAEQDRSRLLESERAARSQLERVSQIKDEFLATLSHELRTPLNAILGWAHLIRRDALDKDRLKQGLEVIEKNARAQAQMIGDLLDMSRIISGKIRLEPRSVDLKSIINSAIETITPVAQAKKVSIRAELDPDLGLIQGDPNRLQQVLWNLLTNAVRFSQPESAIDVFGKEIGGEIHISVQDYGEGIKPEFIPHVFDRFRQADASTTRRHGGLGLGLSIVKHLVELHGGSVSVESKGLGTGATFSVHLPRSPTAIPSKGLSETLAAAPSRLFRSEQPSLMGLRVLAVDDEEDTRNLLKVILEEEGAIVTAVDSSSAGLQEIEMKRPDLIVSDISMPDEDGYQFIRQVRARGHARGGDVPAIALTAFARPEDKQQALTAGFQMHLAKPIEPARLVQAAWVMAHPQ